MTVNDDMEGCVCVCGRLGEGGKAMVMINKGSFIRNPNNIFNRSPCAVHGECRGNINLKVGAAWKYKCPIFVLQISDQKIFLASKYSLLFTP